MNVARGKLPVSGVVIAKNEGDRIARCVASLAAVCGEVIVLDSGSSDDTVVVATAAGARVEQQPWLGFAAQKNAVIARASQPWVLLLDADEWLDPDDLPKLRALFASGEVERADVWRLPRRTHFLGTPLNHGGWGREQVERLFRPDLRYQPSAVHEKLGRRVVASPASTCGSNTTPRARTTSMWPSCGVTRGCGRSNAMTRANAPPRGLRRCTRPPTG